MNHELARLNKERGIIAAKKQEAQKALFQAEAQRTNMLMHFSRKQQSLD